MKGIKNILAIMVVSSVIFGATAIICFADEAEKKTTGVTEKREMSDQMAERILERIKENDPAKVEELEKLRSSDSDAFKSELRKITRSRLGPKGSGSDREMRGPRRDDGRGEGRGPRGRRGDSRRETYQEFIKWFEVEFPEEAKELADLKDKDPKGYNQRLGISFRRYGRIFEASKDDPELAKVLKEDMSLRRMVWKLRRDIEAAKTDTEKEQLKAELKTVLSQRYDVILKRRQIEYEQLLDRLEKLKDQIKQSKAELAERKKPEFKEKNVEARLKDLLSDKKKRFRWD